MFSFSVKYFNIYEILPQTLKYISVYSQLFGILFI